MRIWAATLALFIHLALSLPNGIGQVYNPPSDLSAIPAGETVSVFLAAPLDRRTAKVGDSFTATVDGQIVINNQILVPEGSEARGHIASVKRPSRLKQMGASTRTTGEMDLALDEIATPKGVKYSISGSLTAAGDVKHTIFIPAGIRLTFVISTSKPPHKPAEVAVPIAKQEAAQESSASEPLKPLIKVQTQPAVPDTHSGVLTAEKPIQPQAPLTPPEAQERAQALLGESPDRVEIYFSIEDKLNYLAFSIRVLDTLIETQKNWKRGRDEVWIYKEDPYSHLLKQVWYERDFWHDLAGWALDGFVSVQGQRAPCLRIKGSWGGSSVSGTRLGLYSVEGSKLNWVEYSINSSQTGLRKVAADYRNAPDAGLLGYLKSWGHELGEDSRTLPDIEGIQQLEQSWIDANGQKACPQNWVTSSLSQWKTSGNDKLIPYRTRKLGNEPRPVLDDGPYQWLSYFRGGVGGYSKQNGSYFLLYVPKDGYNASKKLVVIGAWLYIQDCVGDHWAVRFNKTTHSIERGDFDDIVGSLDTGVYPATRSNKASAAVRTETKDATVPIIHPYDLVKNPFAHRGSAVRLDVGSWPYMLNGQVFRWISNADVRLGGGYSSRKCSQKTKRYTTSGD